MILTSIPTTFLDFGIESAINASAQRLEAVALKLSYSASTTSANDHSDGEIPEGMQCPT